MNLSFETNLDFDQTVSTEDRFRVRKFIEHFVDTVNTKGKVQISPFLSDSITAEGFSEFVLQKSQLLELWYKKFFGRRNNVMRLPKLVLTSQTGLFRLEGDYEDYDQGILSNKGDIKISVVKNSDDQFLITKIIFLPKMRKVDSDE